MKTLLARSAAVIVVASGGLAHALTTTGWGEYASNPVHTDESGKAYYPAVIRDGDSYMMWYATNTGIRMTTSLNGVNWEPPVDVSGLSNANHPHVKKVEVGYRIWYWDTSYESYPYTINSIRTATSGDGVVWKNDMPVTQVGTSVISGSGGSPVWRRGSYGPGCAIYNPSGSGSIVILVDESSVWQNRFIFYYMATLGWDESIGLAVSNDGINWHGYVGGALPVLAGPGDNSDWDWSYVGYPTVIKEAK